MRWREKGGCPAYVPELAILSMLLEMAGGCAAPIAYESPSRTAGGATIIIEAPETERRTGWVALSEEILVDIYDFKTGCPDVGLRTKSTGYKGSVTVTSAAARRITVSSGGRLVLRGAWMDHGFFSTSSCDAILTFIPEDGGEYLFTYRAPSGKNRACAASLVEEVQDEDGKRSLARVPSLVAPTVRRGWFTGYRSPELCALKPR
jgi:hypothetical protein